MSRRFDHVDLRVRNLAGARPFYDVLLPAIGLTREESIPGWLTYEAEDSHGATAFFGVTESSSHVANECRVAFGANSREEVDRLAAILRQAGARNIVGPLHEEPQYYAVFFEDPCGNRLEICFREKKDLSPSENRAISSMETVAPASKILRAIIGGFTHISRMCRRKKLRNALRCG